MIVEPFLAILPKNAFDHTQYCFKLNILNGFEIQAFIVDSIFWLRRYYAFITNRHARDIRGLLTYIMHLISEDWLTQLTRLTREYHLIFTFFPPKKPLNINDISRARWQLDDKIFKKFLRRVPRRKNLKILDIKSAWPKEIFWYTLMYVVSSIAGTNKMFKKLTF